MEVKIENLVKTFVGKKGQKTVAVNNMTFDIPDGKLCGLLGPSGCGKSTTLYMIAGIHVPTEGRIYFGDEDVTNVPPENRGIGLVFQNYALYPHLNVRQNIMFPLDNVVPKLTYDEKCALVLENAKIVNLEKLLDRKPKELSGGQQQRVAIARALAKRPRVLLLDEPLSNLDARLRLQTREEIKRIQKETGITTIFVTHDQEEAMSISDFIVVMKDGVVQQKDEPQKVYEEPANLFVAKFLGTPAINVYDGNIEEGKLLLGGKTLISDEKLSKVHVEELVCPNCANVVSHNAKYCNYCGANLLSSEAPKTKKKKSEKETSEEVVYDFYKNIEIPASSEKKINTSLKKLAKLLNEKDNEEVVNEFTKVLLEVSSSDVENIKENETRATSKLHLIRGIAELNLVETTTDEEKEIIQKTITEIDAVSLDDISKAHEEVHRLIHKCETAIKVLPHAHEINEIYKESDWEGTKKIKEVQIEILNNSYDVDSDEAKERIEKIVASLKERLNPNRTCKVGIRAEHFELDENGPIKVKVFNIEHIGRDISVVGDIVDENNENITGNSHVKIIISSELAEKCNGKEYLNFTPKRLYVFEETGERIY